MICVNEVGTLNLIRLCLEYDSKLVCFITLEIYGKIFDEKEVVEEDFS